MVKRFSFKALSLLLILCLLPLGALASSDPLVCEELITWRNSLNLVLPTLLEEAPEGLYDEQNESWSFVYPFGSVICDASSPLEGTLTQVEIVNDTLSCPRGIRVGDTLESLLEVYGISGISLPETLSSLSLYTDTATYGWGWMLGSEDGSLCVQFAAPMSAEGMEGYVWDLNIRYMISGGLVSSIVADGFAQGITIEECKANFAAASEAGSAALTAQALEAGNRFEADDLIFSGLDFSYLTLDELISALGQPQQTEDDEHGIRTCLFEDVLAECLLEDGLWRVNALVVSGASLPGPRGMLPGMSAEEVLAAFGGYPVPEENTQLYEDLSQGCWGQYTLEDAQPSVTYGITLDSQRYVLTVSFSDGVVTEYLIYHE